jgi:hypothetical protein
VTVVHSQNAISLLGVVILSYYGLFSQEYGQYARGNAWCKNSTIILNTALFRGGVLKVHDVCMVQQAFVSEPVTFRYVLLRDICFTHSQLPFSRVFYMVIFGTWSGLDHPSHM